MAFNFLKNLESDDIFISYSREDGSAYLTGLDAALSARGFSCFTDKRGTDADRLPPKTLFRKIRLCKTLVLLATPGALKKPENIAPEISEFAEANGTSRIICVSFDRDAEFADWSRTPWYSRVEGKAREREEPGALKTGEPSPSVVETIAAASTYMKSKDRLRRYRNQALLVLALLIVASAAAGGFAFYQLQRAAAATAEATEAEQRAAQATRAAQAAQAQAQVAKDEAQAAQDEARTAKSEAETARADAMKQKNIADAATKDAEAKTKLAADAARQAREAEQAAVAAKSRADQEQSRANREQAIAEARSLANRSQILLKQKPEALQRSISLAVDATAKASSISVHMVEPDTALRESLALLPRLRYSKKYAEEDVSPGVAFSPDGRHLARLSTDNKLRIYESGGNVPLREQTPLKVLDCECSTVMLSNGLAYAVAILNEDGGVKIFDLNAPVAAAPPRVVKLEDGVSPDKIALSPSGRYLAFSFNVGEDVDYHSVVRIMETGSGKLIRSFDENMSVTDIAFGAFGKLAVGGNSKGVPHNGRVLLWAPTGSPEPGEVELTGDSSTPFEVIELESGVEVVAPGNDETFFATDKGVWKKRFGKSKYELVSKFPYSREFESTSVIRKMFFAPDNKSLTLIRDISVAGNEANGENETVLEVWDSPAYPDLVQVFHDAGIYRVGFKPGEHFVATLTDWGEKPRRVFRAVDGKEVETEAFTPDIKSENLKYTSPDANYLVACGENVAEVWDVWGKKKATATFDALKEVEVATLSHGGKFLALSGPDTANGELVIVYRLDGNSYREWKKIPQGGTPTSMSLSADGQRLAILYKYDTNFVRVWHVGGERDVTPESLEYKAEIKSESFSSIPDMQQMALSPGGRFLVTIDMKNQVQLFDLSRGTDAPPTPLIGDTKIGIIAFSRDDRYLGLGSDEGIVHVFDTSRPQDEIARLRHTGTVSAVAFSDDNKYVATASSDPHDYRLLEEESYPLRVWLLQPADLMKEARDRLDKISAAR